MLPEYVIYQELEKLRRLKQDDVRPQLEIPRYPVHQNEIAHRGEKLNRQNREAEPTYTEITIQMT